MAPALSPALRQRISRVVKVVRVARELPTPPVVIGKLTALLADPNYRTSELVRLVEMDPGLTTAALGLANGAFFKRAGGEVDSVRRAIETIGERRLTQLLVARAGESMQSVPLIGYGEALSQAETDNKASASLWSASLHRAIAAETVARSCQSVPWSRAYTIGLLMDIGKLALGQFIAQRKRDPAWVTAEHAGHDLAATEDRLLGIDHAELGARLAWSWGLPAPFQHGIRYHHRPSDAPEEHQPLAFTLHLADVIATGLGLGGGAGDLAYREDPKWPDVLGLTRDQVTELAAEVKQATAEAAAMLESP